MVDMDFDASCPQRMRIAYRSSIVLLLSISLRLSSSVNVSIHDPEEVVREVKHRAERRSER